MGINRKNLVVGIAIGVAIAVTVIFILTEDLTTLTYSVATEDTTKPIQQGFTLSQISSCSQTKEINESYKECVILNSNVSGINNLPSPIFEYFTPGGASNYPPPPSWGIVEPKTRLLSQEQIEKVIDIIRNDPEIKSQPFAWKVHDMQFYPFNYSWYDDVFLTIHGIKESSTNGVCGWHARVTIDLNTLTIVKKENTDVVSYNKC